MKLSHTGTISHTYPTITVSSVHKQLTASTLTTISPSALCVPPASP